MNTLTKTLAALTVAFGTLAATQASASVIVTYGGQAATDGSGVTSVFVPADNKIQTLGAFHGYFIETFDTATQMTFLNLATGHSPLTTSLTNPDITIQQPADGSPCGFNSYGSLGVTTHGGGMGIQRGGTSGVAANPRNDTSCFASAPGSVPGNRNASQGASGADPAQIALDYSNLLANPVIHGSSIDYVGFYLGSIDYYNTVFLYDGNTLVDTVTGAQILGPNAPFVGNWTDPRSNIYVNMAISHGEHVNKVVFQSSGIAVEVDNVVVGVTPVPEPESLALMVIGLVGLAVAGRRRQVAQEPRTVCQ